MARRVNVMRALHGALWVSLVTLLFGCSTEHGDAEQVGASRQEALTAPFSATITLSAPHSVAPTAPVIEAANSVAIGPQASIAGTTVALGTGPQGVNAGPQALLNDTWSRGGVNFGPQLHLTGTLHARIATVDPSAIVDAFDRTPVFDPVSTLSWQVTFPATLGAGVHTLNGQAASLAPGGYTSLAVDSGGTVTLRSGTYYFTSLTVSAGAHVNLDQTDGAVIVYVSSGITVNATFKATSGDPPNLLLGYLGTNAVTIGGSGAPFNGALVAPFTILYILVASSPHAGFFAARDVSIGSTAKVQYALPFAMSTVAVHPRVICVANQNGSLRALFGYTNDAAGIIRLPVGPSNAFSPAPIGRGQVQTFLMGRHDAEFSTAFSGAITWTTPGGSATANAQSPVCPTPACTPACAGGEACVGGRCATLCGDNVCAGEEGCNSCLGDCGCGASDVCYHNGCATPIRCGKDWQCGSGSAFGQQVDCGACSGGTTCVNHVCK
jgi:hypothetical protein